MYDYFKKILWPLDKLPSAVANGITYKEQVDYVTSLKELFIDFRLNLYVNTWPTTIISTPPVIYISKFQATNAESLNIQLSVRTTTPQQIIASNLLSLGNSAEEYVTYHFDSTDFPSLPAGMQIEGFICMSNIAKFLASYPTFIQGPIVREYPAVSPAAVSMFTGHRVSSIACRNTLPLLCQSPDAKYLAVSSPVSGDVKLVEGSNCVISIQPSTNTVVVSAQIDANVPSGESNCGKWAEKISVPSVSCTDDTLCNEVVYAISGVSPDDNGNLQIQADAPIAVSSLTPQSVPDAFKPLLTGSEFSSIIRVIYVGLPQGQNNSSVFDCDAV